MTFSLRLALQVHTVRELPQLVSSSRHLANRKNEALSYGLLPPAIGRATALTAAVQSWLAGFLRTVHERLLRTSSHVKLETE